MAIYTAEVTNFNYLLSFNAGRFLAVFRMLFCDGFIGLFAICEFRLSFWKTTNSQFPYIGGNILLIPINVAFRFD